MNGAIMTPDGPAVTRLKLAGFRNYASLDLALDARSVVLFGENGSGKTNLVEAVSFLGPGRGLRSAGAEAVRRRTGAGTDPIWAVYAEAICPEGRLSLATGADPARPDRRRTRLDGAAATRTELARRIPMLWLTPREDRLWAGSRADRLRFFDRLVLAATPGHADSASIYEKSMKERQRLLIRQAEGGEVDPDWLSVLEREMAAAGVAQAAARLEALTRLQYEIDSRPQSRFPKAELALNGAVEAQLAAGLKAGEVEDWFGAELEQVRVRDSAAKRTLTGPHRTELTARHRDKDRPATDCSTGEQKSMALGLILAQAAVIRRLTDRGSVLILDEACAHLDQVRRTGLAETVLDLGVQAWVTGVERALFEPFGAHAQRMGVSDGRIERIG